ncbi:MAG: FUSC family protein [Pseudomonadota bacterium]
MTASSPHAARWRTLLPTPDAARYGVQLALAVLLANGASLALGLPEGLWAVMSTLIVMRPQAGATLDAGWDRLRGTAVGIAAGLAGIALQHAGLPAAVATLGMVGLLAFATAGMPALRASPISALIILSASNVAGHSPAHLAVLRAAEIGVGVVVGLGVSLLITRVHSAARLRHGVDALLREVAAQTRLSLGADPRSEAERLIAGAQIRSRLMRLAVLATSADREQRWNWPRRGARSKPPAAPDGHRRLFGRLRDTLPALRDESLWADVSQAVQGALLRSTSSVTTATGVSRTEPSASDALRDLGSLLRRMGAERRDRPDWQDAARLLAGPLRLLAADLKSLASLSADF